MSPDTRIIGGIPITHCEFDIIGLAIRGMSYKEIAAQLNKKPTTIASQMRTLYLKTGLRKISGLVAWALGNGFTAGGAGVPKKASAPLSFHTSRKVSKPRALKGKKEDTSGNPPASG